MDAFPDVDSKEIEIAPDAMINSWKEMSRETADGTECVERIARTQNSLRGHAGCSESQSYVHRLSKGLMNSLEVSKDAEQP